MLTELSTSLLLVWQHSPPALINQTGLICVLLIWISTFGLQAPIHAKLRAGYNDRLVKRLIRTNWIRTALWSLKSVSCLYGL